MITIHNAIRVLNPNVVTIDGYIAYDAQGNKVEYNKSAAETKLAQLQAEETAKQEAEISAKASAQAKLSALGLTTDEIKAILGTT